MHAGFLSFLATAGLAAALPPNGKRNEAWPTTSSSQTQPTGTDNYSGVAQYTSTASSAVATAAATALTESPTSDVKGKVFDRVLQIYLETTYYDNAIADDNCKALYDQGILLTELYGVGDPSAPAYVAAASGDYFGLNSDSFILIDRNVSTIVDLLDDKGISWGDYNEGLPYSGFEGFEYHNPVEGNYVRKHNALIRFDSVSEDPERLAKIKNFTLFNEDLENQRLPQWSFVTPNLFNNGHDTNISVSCAWTRGFVESLLQNEYFNDDNTLIYVTWQANGQFPKLRNHVAGFLLGSAVTKAGLAGTKDDAYYSHYSEISSIGANWDLHTLGRWDVGANVWSFVGRVTGDSIRTWNPYVGPFESYYWNQSHGGVFNSAENTSHIYPEPNLDMYSGPNKRSVLPAIADLWSPAAGKLPDYYKDMIEIPDAVHPPQGFEVPLPLDPAPPITTPITVWPSSTATTTTSTTPTTTAAATPTA